MLVVYACFHPRKLDQRFWLMREIEYFYCIESIIKIKDQFNYIVIENSISSIDEIQFKPLRELLQVPILDWPVANSQIIFDPSLYDEDNLIGARKMMDFVRQNTKYGGLTLFVNGRQYFRSAAVVEILQANKARNIIYLRHESFLQNTNIFEDNVFWLNLNQSYTNSDDPSKIEGEHHIIRRNLDVVRTELDGSEYTGYRMY